MMQLYYFIYKTKTDPFYVFSNEKTLVYASFKNEVATTLLNEAILTESLPILQEAKAWLASYFAGTPRQGVPPFTTKGTNFQEVVWALLTSLSFGELITYGDLSKLVAKKLGRELMSAQAVGTAVGQNPLSLFIPCHRVVAANNKIGGYGGGISNKKALLMLEGYNITGERYYEKKRKKDSH